MAFHRITVDESDAAARGMPRVRPISCFQQHRPKQADLDHFSTHTIDFDPVADADAIASHQNKPAEEGNNKVLQSDRQPSTSQANDGGSLVRCAEDDEQNQQNTQSLYREPNHEPHGLQPRLLPPVALKITIDQRGCEVSHKNNQKHPEERPTRAMHCCPLLRLNERPPVGVVFRQLLLVLYSLIQI